MDWKIDYIYCRKLMPEKYFSFRNWINGDTVWHRNYGTEYIKEFRDILEAINGLES